MIQTQPSIQETDNFEVDAEGDSNSSQGEV